MKRTNKKKAFETGLLITMYNLLFNYIERHFLDQKKCNIKVYKNRRLQKMKGYIYYALKK